MATESRYSIAYHVRQMLFQIGEDAMRQGLADTPTRVERMWREELFYGVGIDPVDELRGAIFEEPAQVYDALVMVRDIPVMSVCEHHLVPFIGKAYVGYVPGDAVVGLSKIARAVDIICRRPQVQERVTSQIVDALEEALAPKGCMAVVKAEHFCMTLRGVKSPGTSTVTSAVRGVFMHDGRAREEFLHLMDSPSG